MKYVYNYKFKLANQYAVDKKLYYLEEGGPQAGTMSGGKWIFDGQLFIKVPGPWSKPEQPKIHIVIK